MRSRVVNSFAAVKRNRSEETSVPNSSCRLSCFSSVFSTRRVTGLASTDKGESKGAENLHLVTHDIVARKTVDHGPVLFADGGRPGNANSIAVGRDGTVYTIARIPGGNSSRVDLISFKPAASPAP